MSFRQFMKVKNTITDFFWMVGIFGFLIWMIIAIIIIFLRELV